MNRQEFNDYLEKRRKDELITTEAARLVKMFEERCEELKNRMESAVGWSNKENIRKSLKTNQELLEKAKKLFWGESL
jgi:hypothetical protein